MSAEKESSVSQRRLSCTKCFDALWFCYSPVHQLQQYYREGVLDNCYGKWSALWDCLYLKTKPSSQLQLKADWRNLSKMNYQQINVMSLSI
ncbi:hypothetical protein Gohar_010750 [Gossypium harknessii]|uniref:Uncharacterized protein n=2 Tax=Gossypium TaxID=3633 RepID=A0A7J9BUW3_GOSGO|nr:hypothetical protein [Gossypium gossypioides]MBA0800308.1 hypothetical protein [Gossypium harknessii]